MMTVLQADYPSSGVLEYMQAMTGKIFKILPLYEDSAPAAYVYIENFLRELVGFKAMIGAIGDDADFVSMLATIRGIQSIEGDQSAVKSDVFKAIRLCNMVRERHFDVHGSEVRK